MSPGPSAPSSSATRSSPASAPGGPSPDGVSAASTNPAARSAATSTGHDPPSERHPEHVAHRHPHAAPVERVGAARREQDRVDPQRGGVAEERAEVLVVVHGLEHGHPARPGEQVVQDGRRGPVGAREHPAVEVEADDGGHGRGVGDEGRDVEARELRPRARRSGAGRRAGPAAGRPTRAGAAPRRCPRRGRARARRGGRGGGRPGRGRGSRPAARRRPPAPSVGDLRPRQLDDPHHVPHRSRPDLRRSGDTGTPDDGPVVCRGRPGGMPSARDADDAAFPGA